MGEPEKRKTPDDEPTDARKPDPELPEQPPRSPERTKPAMPIDPPPPSPPEGADRPMPEPREEDDPRRIRRDPDGRPR